MQGKEQKANPVTPTLKERYRSLVADRNALLNRNRDLVSTLRYVARDTREFLRNVDSTLEAESL